MAAVMFAIRAQSLSVHFRVRLVVLNLVAFDEMNDALNRLG